MTNEFKDFLRTCDLLPGVLLMMLASSGMGKLLDSWWPPVFSLAIIMFVWAVGYRVRRHLDAINKRLESLEFSSLSDRLAPFLEHAASRDEIDRIITTVRKSKSTEEAEANLIREFGFSGVQAREVLNLRLLP